MNCTDRRLVSICSDIFRIIKSGEEKGEVHGKEITVRKSASSGSSIVSLTIGLMSIDMIMKPFRVNDGTNSGSDEGANVFIILPFQDGASNGIRIPAYYSERNKEPELTCSVSDAMKSPTHSGTRRIVQEYNNVTLTKPY